MNFEEYLRAVYEEDDLIPEEVLDVIEWEKSNDIRPFYTREEILKNPDREG